MGAHNFRHTVRGIKDPLEAYRDLVAEAEFTSGHDPYSGTIATTNGLEIRRREPIPYGEELDEFIYKDMEHAEKWGCAFCVPFSDQVLVPVGRSRVFTLHTEYSLQAATSVKEHPTLLEWADGHKLAVEVLEKQEVLAKVDRAVRKSVTDEEAVYLIHTDVARYTGRMVKGTKEEVRARVRAWMNDKYNPIARARISRVSPLEEWTLSYENRPKLKIKVRAQKQKRADENTIAGWAFYGWAAT